MRTITAIDQAVTLAPPVMVTAAAAADPLVSSVLYDVWAGDPIVLVSSPPGAGKTRLITLLAQELTRRAGLRVAIAAQTRAQAQDVASRIAALGVNVTLLDGKDQPLPGALHPAVTHLRGPRGLTYSTDVVVATTARWHWTGTDRYRADVLMVDEAWQITHADLLALGDLAQQLVMVGDPGQIAPVVTGATHRWSGHAAGPHLAAPTALRNVYPDSITDHQMTRTWRCGPQTTALIQPVFYPTMPFTSARPPMHLTTPGSGVWPELVPVMITPTSEHDTMIAEAAADQVRNLLGSTFVTGVGTGTSTRLLTGKDIAVVTPHVHHASHVAALTTDIHGLLIGTANAVQGSERVATVVIHPMTGQHLGTEFNLDLGRTCVALTRHQAHARVVIDTQTPARLHSAVAETPVAEVHLQLLEHLLP